MKKLLGINKVVSKYTCHFLLFANHPALKILIWNVNDLVICFIKVTPAKNRSQIYFSLKIKN